MKKRVISLALTLALCVGLSVPVMASDVSGLDASTAQAYYHVLTEQIQKEGIRTSKDGHGIAYAGLEDMDADGSPELMIIGFGGDWKITLGIWSIKNGAAVQTFDDIGMTGAINGSVALARKNNQVRLFYDYYWSYKGYEGRELSLIDADGNEEKSYYSPYDGSSNALTSMEEVTYDKTWIVDSTPILKTENSLQWDYSASQPQAVSALQSTLLAKANNTPAPTAGTYGPYMITGATYDGTAYTISFSAAKVEQKTVQIREHYDIEGGDSAYQSETITLVTIKPDTRVTVSGGYNGEVPVSSGKSDGNDKYTQLVMGVVESLHTSTGKGIFDNVAEGQNFIRIDHYFIIVDTNAAPAGFTDVKAGAYYEEAVKWAVDKNITSGTSATTFSPDQTCTVAQILTFLWRANGSPEPMGQNPFSDISSGDYYYKAAIWAYGKGLVSGNKLNPNAACTRSMTVTYLWKLAGSPTVQNENYKPLTLTETRNGNTCIIAFDAASMKQSSLKLCEDQFSGDGIEHNEKIVSGTLLTVPSGSRIKINNPGDADTPWGEYAIETKWYYSDSAGVFHSDPGISSEALSNGEVIKDNAIAPFVMNGTTYLLSTVSASSSFTDVSANATYAQAVAWAVEKGITAGTSATTFSPNATCTRGQIVTFLHRAMG